MKLTLKIQSDNAALADDPRGETARLLREAADRVESGAEGYKLLDSNGNPVGDLELVENDALRVPTVHLNGTSAESLCGQLEDAARVADNLLGMLSAAAPNARDYYVQEPGAFDRAARQHDERVERVGSVLRELHQIYEAIVSATEGK